MGNIDVQANTDKDGEDTQDSCHGIANLHTLTRIMETEDDRDLHPDAEDGGDGPHGRVAEWDRLALTRNSEFPPPEKVNKRFRCDMDDDAPLPGQAVKRVHTVMDDDDEPPAPEQTVKSFDFHVEDDDQPPAPEQGVKSFDFHMDDDADADDEPPAPEQGVKFHMDDDADADDEPPAPEQGVKSFDFHMDDDADADDEPPAPEQAVKSFNVHMSNDDDMFTEGEDNDNGHEMGENNERTRWNNQHLEGSDQDMQDAGGKRSMNNDWESDG